MNPSSVVGIAGALEQKCGIALAIWMLKFAERPDPSGIWPMTIGELWAWPSMLKLALIENLRRLAEQALAAREARQAANAYVAQIDAAGHGRLPPLPRDLHPAFVVQLLQRSREYGPRLSAVRAAVDAHLAARRTAAEDEIRSEHRRQGSAQVSVENVVTSLRLCSTLDWSQYFEAVSLVEVVLQRDPAAVYGGMDFLSRDRYRQAVEELADGSGEGQLRVALRAVESANQAAERGDRGRATHIGHHLVGAGRPDLEADVAYRPVLARRVRRFGRLRPAPRWSNSTARKRVGSNRPRWSGWSSTTTCATAI